LTNKLKNKQEIQKMAMITDGMTSRDKFLFSKVCNKVWDRSRSTRLAISALVRKNAVDYDDLTEEEQEGMQCLIKEMLVCKIKDTPILSYKFTPGAKA
jgi:hypothetical protein